MNKSQNVLVSVGKLKNNRKSALIKSMAHNFWNVPNGMVCTIWFSNQNFRVFRVNGKDPLLLEGILIGFGEKQMKTVPKTAHLNSP